MAKPVIAIMYDFDKTLCTSDMQNFGFVEDLKMTPAEFWSTVAEYNSQTKSDKVLAYMYMMLKIAKEKGLKFTKEYLKEKGKSVVLYKGVESWFKRINQFGDDMGVRVEHYIISSGIKEMIEGSSIAKEFKKIFACEYVYGDNQEAIWPKTAINFTNKTQYIFRISKGTLDETDEVTLNQAIPDGQRKVQYNNMIYIGDGMTDIPCMKLVKEKGGKSIALYQKNQEDKVLPLVSDDRINYVCVAYYSENSNLDKIIKMMIENMALIHKLKEKEQRTLGNFVLKTNKKADE